MSEDSVRNATVIADEETDLLVVSRELFNRSMKVCQYIVSLCTALSSLSTVQHDKILVNDHIGSRI